MIRQYTCEREHGTYSSARTAKLRSVHQITGLYILIVYNRKHSKVGTRRTSYFNRVPKIKLLIIRDRFLDIPLIRDRPSTSVNVADGLLAIKQSRSLFQAQALGFDDENIAEGRLECEPAAVEDLR